MPLVIIPDRGKSHHIGENKIKAVALHHSLTTDGVTLTKDDITVDHMGLVPWSRWLAHPMDLDGYHAYCELVDRYYEIIVGRPETWVGGHCPQGDMNDKSFGLCFIGNFDLAPPPDLQLLVAIRRIIVPVMYRYDLSIDAVKGHAYYANDGRTCPGKLFPWDRFYGMIEEEIG